MAERFKALNAVVGAHAARPDSTEGEVRVAHVEEGRIHRCAPGAGPLQHLRFDMKRVVLV